MEYNKYRILANWATGDDTGLSSRFLSRVALDLELGYPDTPCDPSDFGRCYRMVQLLSQEDREDLFAKAKVISTKWRAIIENWAELESLYLEECTGDNWNAPKLYGTMKKLGL